MKLNKSKLIIYMTLILIWLLISIAMVVVGSVFLSKYLPNFVQDIHNSIFNYVLAGSILLGLGLFNFLTNLIILFTFSSNYQNKVKELFKKSK